MNTPIVFPDEATVRLPKLVHIRQGREGQWFQTKISKPLLVRYEKSKARVAALTDKEFSQTIFVRTALAMYLHRLEQMTDEQITAEAYNLMIQR